MVGRRERLRDAGISEKEYRLLFLIAGVFSLFIAVMSLFRRLSGSWAIRSLAAGLLASILIYYSTLSTRIKSILVLSSWIILAVVALAPLSYGVRMLLSLLVVVIAIYTWTKRPLPLEKGSTAS